MCGLVPQILVGVDIGGTKCAVVLGTADGRVLAKESFPTETARGPSHTLDRLLHTIASLLTRPEAGDTPPVFGISCGGPLSSREGLILSPPNLPGWDRVPITRLLTERFGGRAFLMNDANAGALAEWNWGAARGTRDAIFLTFGTGLGAGLIINGHLHAGADDLAGEVGHLRLAEDGPVGFGKAGSFEGFCSGGGITRLARERIRQHWSLGYTVSFCPDETALENLELRTVANAARLGDPLAAAVFETSAFYLGRGLALLVDLLNPEVICIGGVYGRCEDLLGVGALRELTREALPDAMRRCRIVPAALGESIGDLAALAVARAGLDQTLAP
jgi:glucokinase